MIDKLKTIGGGLATVIGWAYLAAAIAMLLWLPERIRPVYGYQKGTDDLVDRAVVSPKSTPVDDTARPLSLDDKGQGRRETSTHRRRVDGQDDEVRRERVGSPSPHPQGRLYRLAVAEIHRRKSRCGQDPRSRRGFVGRRGERGEFQVTPIWQADCRRLFGEWPDPYDVDQVRRLIPRWLAHYAPRVGAGTAGDMCELYRRGPTGYRRARARRRAAEIAEKTEFSGAS